MGVKIEDYNEGVEIAEQITTVMQSDADELNDIEQYDKLEEWIKDNPYSKNIIERLSSETTLEQLNSNFNRKKECDFETARLMSTINKKQSKIIRRRIIRTISGVAAAIAVSFIIFYQTKDTIPETSLSTVKVLSTGKITKASSTPTLILNNGDNFDLTKVSEKIDAGNYSISKDDNNQLTYDKSNNISAVSEYNTLVVPKMYTYNVVLEDGTTVYLNANSELKYPVKFNNEKREVYLKGEGYFDVAKSKKPFIVITNDVQIKVYGTKFNVNSHSLSGVKTALLEGSIGVSLRNNDKIAETLVKPNQLFIIDNKGNVELREIDPSQYTAWISGFIKGNNESLAELLNNVAKWYGVELIYSDTIKDIPIEASLNSKRPIDEILNSIEIIADIKIIKKSETKYMIL